MKEEDKKESILKRLKNIEDKTEEQLKAIKIKNENLKRVTDFVEEPLRPKLKNCLFPSPRPGEKFFLEMQVAIFF